MYSCLHSLGIMMGGSPARKRGRFETRRASRPLPSANGWMWTKGICSRVYMDGAFSCVTCCSLKKCSQWAYTLGRAVAPFNIMYYEEPTHSMNLENMTLMAHQVRIPWPAVNSSIPAADIAPSLKSSIGSYSARYLYLCRHK